MKSQRSAVIRVCLFAYLRDLAGWSERLWPIDADQELTAIGLWDQLQLGPWPRSLRVAINQQFAAPEQPLAAGDELAFLPPFTGG